jgi:hypothetical protein
MFNTRKPVFMLAESSLTNGASATARIDTLGYKYLELFLRQSTSNSTSNKLATCKLSEADVTSSTSATAITKFVGGGAGGFTIPAADTANPQAYSFQIDLRGRKRYIFLEVSPVTTQTFTAVGALGRAEQNLQTAAHLGTALFVEG